MWRIVMAMAVSLDGSFALSVSADHLIGRYKIAVGAIGTEWGDITNSIDRRPNRRWTYKTPARYSRQNTREMARWRSRTTAAYARSADGTAGTQPADTALGNQTDFRSRVRLYSTKSFKPLGTLAYHKKNCQCVAFARAQPAPAALPTDSRNEESDDEMTEQEKIDRTRWLTSGGQDSRVAIWSLMNFGKT